MFGALRLSQGEQEITRLRTRKTEALLAYLALFPDTPHAREVLAAQLWPDAESRAARNSLSVALSALRAVLEPEGLPTPRILLTDVTHARLDFTLLSSDVARFEEILRAAQATADENRKLSLLSEAVACYRGPLLPSLYETWILEERIRLEALLQESLRQVTRLLVKRKSYDTALEYALRAAKLDPFHDADCRNVMRLYAALGNSREAQNHYRAFVRRLQTEMNCVPARATVALAEQIARRLVDAAPPTPAEQTTPAPASLSASRPGADVMETTPLDRFYGRDTERETLQRWLIEARDAREATLITLTGMGGVGKTRMAREVMKKLFPIFDGRVYFVSLADVVEPAHLFEAICNALHLPQTGEVAPLEQLTAVFNNNPALLILDNFEQLADGGDLHIQALRRRLPAVTLFLTSRQRLNVAGEREFALSPLPTPLASGTPERMEDFACVRLFVDRCCQRDADFTLNSENVEVVAQICARLEGVPLALELAAAWTRTLTLAQLLARLEKRLDLPISHRRDLPQRHRSLRAALEGSYRLLTAETQLFFARLSVFSGGWTLDAAQAVCDRDALEMLVALQDASLIVTEDNGEATRRFRFLETLREFAAEHLTADERAIVMERHAAYFVALAEQGREELKGSGIVEWCTLLEAEYDNFRAILTLCFPEVAGKPQSTGALPAATGVRLAASLQRFWQVRGYRPEGSRWLEAAFAACGHISREDCLVLYMELPDYFDWTNKAVYVERALAFAEETQNPVLRTIAKFVRAQVLEDKAHASYALEEAVALFREANQPRLLGCALNLLGGRYSSLEGKEKEAYAPFEEAIALLRESGDILWLSVALSDFSFYVLAREAPEQAEAFMAEALRLCESIRHYSGRAHGLWILGKVVRRRDLAGAEACFQESLDLHRRYGFLNSMTLPLSELGYTALLKADYGAARSYFLQWHAGRDEFSPPLQDLLMWCALGEGDETAFRFHCEERLRIAKEISETATPDSEALMSVRQMQLLAAVLRNDFASARVSCDQLTALFAKDTNLIPRHVAYFCGARLMAEEGSPQLASRLLGAGVAVIRAEGWHYLPLMQQVAAQTETRLRASQDEASFLQNYEEGKSLNAPYRRTLLLSLPLAASLPV